MKQFLTLGLAIMLALTASAQKNITQFMGIPIDGTKSAMIQKLKTKGFIYNESKGYLEGEFNGRNVRLYVVTNNNKVYRIMVTDAYGVSEGEIKIRFNTLYKQFMNNGKYIPQNMYGEYEIGESEDISYEMSVNNKRFQAGFYQITESDKDTTGLTAWALDKISKKYTEEERTNLSEEESQRLLYDLFLDYINEKISNKSVWFMINETYGDYYITIYYDNELNQANGEDL